MTEYKHQGLDKTSSPFDTCLDYEALNDSSNINSSASTNDGAEEDGGEGSGGKTCVPSTHSMNLTHVKSSIHTTLHEDHSEHSNKTRGESDLPNVREKVRIQTLQDNKKMS